MRRGLAILAVLASIAVLSVPAEAQLGGTASTRLRAFDEVPAVSSPATGRFEARINGAGTRLDWTLSYSRLRGDVTQAHIHFAQRDVNGGIVIFLCSNLGNGPAGTPACPAPPATISGTATLDDVLAIPAQGIAAQDFAGVLRAMRSGITYVNVHSTLFPPGEIRGQLRFQPGGGQGDEEQAEAPLEDHVHHH